MSTRILHCGSDVENYNLCINDKVAGFRNRGPQSGDIVYLVVKINNQSKCGARGVLGDVTDFKPWKDADNYPNSLLITKMEFCKPFKLNILNKVGGKYWSLKYIQNVPALDDKANKMLEKSFNKLKIDKPHKFNIDEYEDIDSDIEEQEESSTDFKTEELETEEIDKIIKEIPDAKIKILGTFQTINFINETDKLKGLEALVNENFYSLFPQYPENRTILIPENRMFLSSGIEVHDGYSMQGIRSIPDALLIIYNKQSKHPLDIYIIEYECFGDRKHRSIDKSNYFNGQVIPQLMKFASNFSIVTDRQIRQKTIEDWSKKIISYIYKDKFLQEKITSWIKEIHKKIHEQQIGFELSNLLKEAFKTDLKVMLIIDDLSTEQKDTLRNVIKAFRLENGESVKFIGHIIKLVQKINMITEEAEYALTVQ